MKNPIRCTLSLVTACAVLPAAGLFAQSPSPAASTTPSVSAPAASTTATEGEEHGGGHMKAYAKLTPEEQQKIKAAHKAAKDDPAVKAADAGRGTKEGRKAYQDAVRAAMIKADPSVEPILEKMKEERHEEHLHKKDLN